MNRYIIYLVIIFIISFGFFYFLRELNLENLKDRYLQNNVKKLLASQNTYNKLSNNFYNDNNEKLADYLKKFLDANNTEKQKIKRTILGDFFRTYKNLSLLGLNQFQIFTKSGLCLLRFNHIKISDDNLSISRPSIKKSISEVKFLQGFEVGRYSDGLRYIYPLFYDGEYIGGYEWSWNHASLIDELRKIYNGWYLLVIDKEILLQKMDIDLIEKNYKPLLGYPNLLYQKNNIKVYSNSSISFLKNLFSELSLYKKIKSKKDFIEISSFSGEDYIVSFNGIKDILGKPIGYFISINKTQKVKEINKIFLMEIFFALIVTALIYLFLYKSNRDKMFMKTIIDSQKDLVILTNGEKLEVANRRFLEFFEVESVKEFRDKYGCICNQFIEIEDTMTKDTQGKNWLEKLLSKPDSDKRISMFDKQRGEERIFITSISRFKDTNSYVVVFSDITEIEQEKHYFKTESMIDHLTRAYNKRTFEMQLLKKIHEVKHFKRENVALIMFDIDHFKQINDKFGHISGDKVLIEIAALVKSNLPVGSNLYRWGGEEFAIILDSCDFKRAFEFAESLRETILNHNFPIDRVVTCSFGVTTIRIEDTKESVIDRADANLYRAKNRGRNRVEGDIDRV